MVSPTSYHSILTKVQAKRLKFVYKLSILAAVAASLTFSFPTVFGLGSGTSSSSLANTPNSSKIHLSSASSASSQVHVSSKYPFLWNCILATFIYRGPVFFLALFIVVCARQFDSTVKYTSHKTLASQAFYTAISLQFIKVSCYYVCLSILVYLISYIDSPLPVYSISKQYRQLDFVNDNFVFFVFNAVAIGIFYGFQHITFQRNKFSLFKYGIADSKPTVSSIFYPIPRLILVSIIFSTIASVFFFPFIFYFIGARQLIYKFNWIPMVIFGFDTNIHQTTLSSKWYVLSKCWWTSLHCIALWEVVNHIYNLYSCIGCLDGNKPISTYSSDPLNTLISGLKDYDHELTRFTAFQELSYIATASDFNAAVDVSKLRGAIYNADSKYGSFWSFIFDECLLVIHEACLRINYRSESDLKHQDNLQLQIQQLSLEIVTDTQSSNNSPSTIFGNSTSVRLETIEMKKYDTPSESKSNAALDKSNDVQVPFKTGILQVDNLFTIGYTEYKKAMAVLDSYSSTAVLPPIFKSIVSKYSTKFHLYKDEFLSTTIGVLFRVTLKRDCESRLVDPIIVGNAVISISHLLCRAIEEDKKGTIQNVQIADVLTLLERPIRATKNYTESVPSSVDLSPRQRQNPNLMNSHLIVLMHDLCINEFFDTCIKYNSKLNDLVLTARVFKLSKRVIDAAIAHRRRPQGF